MRRKGEERLLGAPEVFNRDPNASHVEENEDGVNTTTHLNVCDQNKQSQRVSHMRGKCGVNARTRPNAFNQEKWCKHRDAPECF